MKKIKLKSFGLIEAVIASVIVILVLAAAVVLASSSFYSATTDASYQEAQNIAQKFFSDIQATKSTGNTYLVGNQSEANRFPVECFDTNILAKGSGDATAQKCFDSGKYQSGLPFGGWLNSNIYSADQYGASGFIIAQTGNPQFPAGYFKIKTNVVKPKAGSRDLTACYTKGSVEIGADHCRVVKVDVSWSSRQENHYYIDQYITDWEK